MVNDKLLESLRNIAQYCKPFPISRIAQDAVDEIERLRSEVDAEPVALRSAGVKRSQFRVR